METKHYTTKERVIKQLLENTGRQLMDSGDFYGRGWEKSQYAAYAVLKKYQDEKISLTPGSEDLATLVAHYDSQPQGDIDWECLSPTINLYWWMTTRGSFDHRLQGWFDQFVAQQDEQESLGAWGEYVNPFLTWLEGKAYDPDTYELKDHEEQEIGDLRPVILAKDYWSHYTYNSENWLSRDIVINGFSMDNDRYAFIQIHNGCDARSGFTQPVAYQQMTDHECGFAEWQEGDIYCTNPDHDIDERHYWCYSGSWGYQGSWGRDCIDLEEHEAVGFDSFDEEQLQDFWVSIIGANRQHPVFDPAKLYEHIRYVELPNLERSLREAPIDGQSYGLSEHLSALVADPCADPLINLYRRMMKNMHERQMLGVRFFDGPDVGYCPICGHRLRFTPCES